MVNRLGIAVRLEVARAATAGKVVALRGDMVAEGEMAVRVAKVGGKVAKVEMAAGADQGEGLPVRAAKVERNKKSCWPRPNC